MKRKLTLDVKDKAEFEAIKRAMTDPATMAVVKIVGHLMPLSLRAQSRVVRFASEVLCDPENHRQPRRDH